MTWVECMSLKVGSGARVCATRRILGSEQSKTIDGTVCRRAVVVAVFPPLPRRLLPSSV